MNTTQKIEFSAAIDFSFMRGNVADAVKLLKSLANESRLMVMCVLAEGEISVGKLNQRIDLSQSALSQHLAILREQGLRKMALAEYSGCAPVLTSTIARRSCTRIAFSCV